MKKSLSGFTLIEILVTMSIIGILSLMVMGNVFSSQKKSRDLQRKSDIRQIGQALELYFQDNGQYPIDHSDGEIHACAPPGNALCEWGSGIMGITAPPGTNIIYMALVPADPKGGKYFYDTDADGTYYQLYARLENDLDKDIIKISDKNQVYSGTYCLTGICNYGLASTNTKPDTNHELQDDD